jgi:diacylglycerol kinase (ATP)
VSAETFVIVNGAAGGGRCRARFGALVERVGELVGPLEVVFTRGPGHATELAREAYAGGHRRLLTVGGDGTTYEVVNGLGAGSEATLAMLPLGTGNSFLRDFGVDDEATALTNLAEGRPRAVDLVRIACAEGEFLYLNLLTVGFVTAAGDLTNRRFKPLGEAGYLVAAFIEMLKLRPERDPVRLDGGRTVDDPTYFQTFANSQFTGGAFRIAPAADATDGRVDRVVARAMPRLAFAKNLVAAYEGEHVRDPRVDAETVRTVEWLYPRRRKVMLDGEILELTLERLEVLPGALQVWLPSAP